MSSGGPTTEARTSLQALLRRLAITKIVCVDDEHAPALTVEDILAWLESASPDEVAEAFPGFEKSGLPDVDVRKESFRQWWNDLELAQREECSNAARPLVNKETRDQSPDVDYMSALSEVLQEMEGVAFVALGPKEWASQSGEMLRGPECAQTLFLFDQDMSKQDGRTNEGTTILGSIMAGEADPKPLCGILTHTATAEGQLERWQELANEAGIDRDSFMVIPKSLLTDDLGEFTRQMKAAALAPSFRRLKELSASILAASLDKAKEELQAITVLDFDHMVMRVALGEGIWEGQVLFRLHTHFHRIEAEHQARSDAILSSLIKDIRKVSDIPGLGNTHPSPAVFKIRHGELYEDGNVVNSAQLDVTTGDIFKTTTACNGRQRQLIVVTQACDLAMRSDGRRKVQHAVLLDVVPVSASEAKHSRYMMLPYFSRECPTDRIAVDFLSTTLAPCWALDTCVLSDEGRCGINLDATLPDGLLPAWGARFGDVLAEFRRLRDKCDVSSLQNEADRQDIASRLAPAITSCGLVKASIVGNEVKVPLRRVRRVRPELAMEVVRQYATYIARTPFEVDLARKA